MKTYQEQLKDEKEKSKSNPIRVILLLIAIVAAGAYLLAPKFLPEIQKEVAAKTSKNKAADKPRFLETIRGSGCEAWQKIEDDGREHNSFTSCKKFSVSIKDLKTGSEYHDVYDFVRLTGEFAKECPPINKGGLVYCEIRATEEQIWDGVGAESAGHTGPGTHLAAIIDISVGNIDQPGEKIPGIGGPSGYPNKIVRNGAGIDRSLK